MSLGFCCNIWIWHQQHGHMDPAYSFIIFSWLTLGPLVPVKLIGPHAKGCGGTVNSLSGQDTSLPWSDLCDVVILPDSAARRWVHCGGGEETTTPKVACVIEDAPSGLRGSRNLPHNHPPPPPGSWTADTIGMVPCSHGFMLNSDPTIWIETHRTRTHLSIRPSIVFLLPRAQSQANRLSIPDVVQLFEGPARGRARYIICPACSGPTLYCWRSRSHGANRTTSSTKRDALPIYNWFSQCSIAG